MTDTAAPVAPTPDTAPAPTEGITPLAKPVRTYDLALTDFGGGPAADAYGARLLEDADFRAWEADAKAARAEA